MLQSMKQLLKRAQQEKFAIPQPDFVNLGMASAYLKAAARHRSPIILGFGEEYIEASEAENLQHLVRLVELLASRYEIPVVLHLDHGHSYEACAKAINAGFSSVMIDGSSLAFEENIRLTKSVVELASLSNVSVEGELGRIRTGKGYDLAKGDTEMLTDPRMALTFVQETGVDALAVSIGTVHGEYQGEPDIKLDLLKEIKRTVPVPLVLHGGSGTEWEILKKCVEEGITKVNIYTDLAKEINRTLHKTYKESEMVQIPLVLSELQQAVIEKLGVYIEVLGASNRV